MQKSIIYILSSSCCFSIKFPGSKQIFSLPKYRDADFFTLQIDFYVNSSSQITISNSIKPSLVLKVLKLKRRIIGRSPSASGFPVQQFWNEEILYYFQERNTDRIKEIQQRRYYFSGFLTLFVFRQQYHSVLDT